MTLVFSRPPGDGPATHAFVIGVGGYPSAKTGAGAVPGLVAPEVPSAADSAKFFCDWLIENRDALVAPLATLEVLISETAEGEERYAWALPQPVGPATDANVRAAGAAWLNPARVRQGDSLLFYCCGHGANLSSEPVLFLGDLNSDPNNPWTFLNLLGLGRALRKNDRIGCAYMFVDACGETIPGFQLAGSQDTRFWPAPQFGAAEAWKVMLLCATPSGLLAHDGAMPNSQVRLGRFTQTLVRALKGSLVSRNNGSWAVDTSNLSFQLKSLQQFYFPGWSDQAFEPGALLGFNEVRKIVVPANPMIPVMVRVNPEQALDGHSFCIGSAPPPPIPATGPIPLDTSFLVWRAEIAPSDNSLYAVAYKGDTCHVEPFTPNRPLFDLRVTIA